MRKDKDLEDIKNGKGLTDVIINDEKQGSLLIERKNRSKGINESVAKKETGDGSLSPKIFATKIK